MRPVKQQEGAGQVLKYKLPRYPGEIRCADTSYPDKTRFRSTACGCVLLGKYFTGQASKGNMGHPSEIKAKE